MSVVVETARSKVGIGSTLYGIDPPVFDRRIAGAGGSDRTAPFVHFHEAAGRALDGVPRRIVSAAARFGPGLRPILERRQYMAVGEPDERVRVAEASHVAERRDDARSQRVRQVEQPRASRVKAVRQQMPVGWHLMFGVMRVGARRAGRKRGDDRTIAW